MSIVYLLKIIALSVFIAVLMTILGSFPPLSMLHDWLVRKNLDFVWVGLIAGVIGLCVTLYLSKRK